MKRSLAGLAALTAVVAIPASVAAHNAGHIILPDGTCLEIGSFRNAPIVGQDRTRLDLVPQTPNPPFDEIGVSFVGFQGRTPIFPGPCGVVHSSSSATAAQTGSKAGDSRAPQPNPTSTESTSRGWFRGLWGDGIER